MEKIMRHTGIAAPLLRENVETDAIIPSRETQSVARSGYAEKLFANWRYEPGTRIENPDFVLNREPFRRASILISKANFGCGSSRESAVWALYQFGIRCVIAESFGSIFRSNCVLNGLLPVSLSEEDVAALAALVVTGGSNAEVTVDLERRRVLAADGAVYAFEIGELEREMLLNGLDDISLTLQLAPQIQSFRERDRSYRPWMYGNGNEEPLA
jgi:3-isopropylmalate/(R)-2-methylmalate dehydratase small subunit